jgi:nucleoside-diphosphate-sugar epimerase
MFESKKCILLTGASGKMGQATLAELFQRSDRFQVRTLALDTPADRKILAPYQQQGLEVVWGDLTCYQDVLQAVSGADIILHVGGLVSPLADTKPDLTMKVNVGAAVNIVRAIHEAGQADQVKLVYIGSVAQTGNRPVPIHWGRVGDPIKLSQFDTYALSKTIAERVIIDSGIKNWVSLRQTGIARMAAAEPLDPITFHTTLDGVLEWITPADSGRLLANICEDDTPESFWGEIYNIGGGEPNRLTNLELFDKMLRATGVKDYHTVLDPRWFALKNFHGQWFADSDRLEEIIPFRQQTIDQYIEEQKTGVPWYIRLGSAIPRLVRRKFECVAQGPRGTLNWLAQGDIAHIKAYFGSFQRWRDISDWETVAQERPSRTPVLLDHGFDQDQISKNFSRQDIQNAALFRGGRLLSKSILPGDWHSPLEWCCHAGHEFSASLNLILKGGHWCPACVSEPSGYAELARHSGFFRQVWKADLAYG